MEEFGVPIGPALSPPRGLRVPGARRPFRVKVGEPVLSREGDHVRFCFAPAPPGATQQCSLRSSSAFSAKVRDQNESPQSV